MPEGHILHRLARLHTEWYSGAPVRVSSPQGRFEDGARAVDGRVLVHADAWGKHLFHHYDGGLAVHVHLGIYGAFTDTELPLGEPVGQVRMRMIGARHGSDLRGPAACEVLTEGEVDAIEARLGPDPLRPDADAERVWTRISRSRSPIGSLLMDQSVIAGVGNVYRAEVLFRHNIHPRPPRTRSHTRRIRCAVERSRRTHGSGGAARTNARRTHRTRRRDAVVREGPSPHVRVPPYR